MTTGIKVSGSALILALLQQCESVFGDSQIILAFAHDIEPDLAGKLLARPNVAGLVLVSREATEQLSLNKPLGYRHGAQLENWVMPKAPAHDVIVFEPPDGVGLRMALSLLRHGVRRIGFIDPAAGTATSADVSYVFIKLVLKRLRRILVGRMKVIWRVMGLARIKPVLRVVQFVQNSLRPSPDTVLRRSVRRLLRDAPKPSRRSNNRERLVVLTIGSLGAGGSERQIVNTALALAETPGVRSIVACTHLIGPSSQFFRERLESMGINVVNVTDHSWKSTQSNLADISPGHPFAFLPSDIAPYTMDYLSFFRSVSPDVVHSFLDWTNIRAGLAAILSGVPRIILSGRSVAPDNFGYNQSYWRLIYRELVAHRSVTISNNSNAGALDYRRWLGVKKLRIPVVYNGIDFEDFPVRQDIDREERIRLGIPPDVVLVGTISRLSEEKRPEVFARAAVEIARHRPDVHFVVAGGGPLEKEVGRIISDARIAHRFHLLGPIQSAAKLLRTLDLFVLTSRKEGLPNVLVEAQAVGVPVVTTPAGGAVETLSPGETGLVSQDHSPYAVADACLSLLEDSGLRSRIAAAAPALVRNRFSIRQMLDNTLRLYG